MSSVLKGIKIAVLGGDDRELYLIPRLCSLGAMINVVGLPLQESDQIRVVADIAAALEGVQVIILPMPGIDATGKIRAIYAQNPLVLTEDVMRRVPRDTLIFVGVARPELKKMVTGHKLIEIADIDQVAILNSIPSAEGAIQMAMESSPITIHGSKSLVIGLGRCGLTLARMLWGIGAKTAVVARKPADFARVKEMGLEPVTYGELPRLLKDADFIFNTVPTLILTAELLEQTNPDTCIIDIASAPGGVDFQAAKALGIKAELAPGLPGKVAPKTAGLILSEIIPQLIQSELSVNPPVSNY